MNRKLWDYARTNQREGTSEVMERFLKVLKDKSRYKVAIFDIKKRSTSEKK